MLRPNMLMVLPTLRSVQLQMRAVDKMFQLHLTVQDTLSRQLTDSNHRLRSRLRYPGYVSQLP